MEDDVELQTRAPTPPSPAQPDPESPPVPNRRSRSTLLPKWGPQLALVAALVVTLGVAMWWHRADPPAAVVVLINLDGRKPRMDMAYVASAAKVLQSVKTPSIARLLVEGGSKPRLEQHLAELGLDARIATQAVFADKRAALAEVENFTQRHTRALLVLLDHGMDSGMVWGNEVIHPSEIVLGPHVRDVVFSVDLCFGQQWFDHGRRFSSNPSTRVWVVGSRQVAVGVTRERSGFRRTSTLAALLSAKGGADGFDVGGLNDAIVSLEQQELLRLSSLAEEPVTGSLVPANWAGIVFAQHQSYLPAPTHAQWRSRINRELGGIATYSEAHKVAKKGLQAEMLEFGMGVRLEELFSGREQPSPALPGWLGGAVSRSALPAGYLQTIGQSSTVEEIEAEANSANPDYWRLQEYIRQMEFPSDATVPAEKLGLLDEPAVRDAWRALLDPWNLKLIPAGKSSFVKLIALHLYEHNQHAYLKALHLGPTSRKPAEL